MNIAFIPSDKSFLNNKLFDSSFGRDDVLEPFSKLKEALVSLGHNVETYDLLGEAIDLIVATRVDRNLNVILKILAKNPVAKVFYLVTEERVVCPAHNKSTLFSELFDAVFTWDDDLIDQRYFIKCNYPNPIRRFCQKRIFSEKKLLVMINNLKMARFGSYGQLYSKRYELVKEFSNNKGFSLYGSGWNNDHLIAKSGCYKGIARSKLEVLAAYKFSIAFENSSVELGGITEKIFDCFGAGSVPIYLGAPNVNKYIPSNCFIDYRNFRSNKDLYKYISEMSEVEYSGYIRAIKLFMESRAYNSFNSKGFVETFVNTLDNLEKLHIKNRSNLITLRIEWIWKYISNFNIIWRNYRIPLQAIASIT
jgi:hypothetical protein